MHEVLGGDIIQPGDCLRIMVSSKIADVPVTLAATGQSFETVAVVRLAPATQSSQSEEVNP